MNLKELLFELASLERDNLLGLSVESCLFRGGMLYEDAISLRYLFEMVLPWFGLAQGYLFKAVLLE